MNRSSPIYRHPLLLFLVGNLVNTATAAYTPKYSPIRYVSFVLCLFICWFALSTFKQYINTTGWPGRTLAGALFTCSLVNVDRLLIRQWSYQHDYLGPASTSPAKRKIQSRWEFGSQVSSSTRCTGSEKEVFNVPYFSTQDKDYMPSLPRFILGHFFIAIALYNLNTIAIDMQLHVNKHLLTDDHIPFFARRGDISVEEVLTRVKISMSYWVAQYCYLQFFGSISAIIAVCLNPSSLPMWRPLFGPLTDASTIRGFWAKFWHQCMQLNVKGPADFISKYMLHPLVLHLPATPRKLTIRYVKILLTFSVSGVMHVAADTGGAVTARESGALGFFCTQAAGIALEDLMQEVWRSISERVEKGGERKEKEKQWMAVGKRIVGYIWVVAWLSYSSPMWVYLIARGMERADMLLDPWAMSALFLGLW